MKYLSYFMVCIAIFSSLSAFSQKDDLGPTFILNGITEDNKEDLEGVKVNVTTDNKVFVTKTTDKRGRFEIEVPYGSVFKVAFSKSGYATKYLEIDTQGVTEEEGKWGFEWPKMKMAMYPIFEGIDYGVLKDPVGKIGYNELIANFDPDKKYQRSISDGIKRLENAIDAARREAEIREETLDEDYQLAIQDGQLFLEEEDYQNALLQFEAAEDLKPQAILPKEKIEEINKILDASRSKEEKYIALLDRADKTFAEESWEESKDFYNRALTVFPDKNYPKEQVIIIDQKLEELAALKRQEAMAAAALKEKQKQFDDLMADGEKALVRNQYNTAIANFEKAKEILPENDRPDLRLAEVKRILGEIQSQYDSFVSQADASFESGNYEMAVNQYKKALELKSDEEYPQTQISLAEEKQGLMADKNKQYNKLIEEAADVYASEDLENALALYQQAASVKPSAVLPKEKITLIEGQIAKRKADEAERLKKEQERLAALKAEYDQLISTADAKFEAEDYTVARELYQQASTKLPEESYPKLQMDKIKTALAKESQIEAQYAEAISKGDKLFDLKSWKEAQSAFKRATELKPTETYPKEKLTLIDNKLAELAALEEERRAAELAKQKEINEQYNQSIKAGDLAFENEEWEQALTQYQAASRLKPKEAYAKQKTQIVQAKLAEIAKAEEEARLAAEQAEKNRSQYNELLAQGNSFYNLENYTAAKKKYNEALELIPGGEEALEKINQIDEILKEKEAEAEAARLAEAERQKKEEAFTSAMQKGNNALALENFDEAIAAYQTAQEVKPNSTVPAEKIAEAKAAQNQLLAQQEAARKAAEERKRKLEQYNKLIEDADALYAEEKLEEARDKYIQAAALFPEEMRPQAQLNKINSILEERRRIAEQNAKTDTEFNLELAKKYPEGKTEKEFKEGNKTVTQIVFVSGGRGDEYRKEVYSWGQKFYLKNGKPYNETNWMKEVNALK